MHRVLSVVLVSVVCASGTNGSNRNELGQVVCAHVLFRHGDRMPLEFYLNDPYKDRSNWPFGVAQLTDAGKRQAFELGQWLRQRYSHLLGDYYDAEEIYVRSTDVDRTLMSAQSVMAGLYHKGRRTTHFVWQPVPVHTVPVQADNLLGASSTCPCARYDAELKRAASLPKVQALQKKFKQMYDYVTNHTGNTVQDFASAIKIYDALSIEEKHNKILPEWAHVIYPEPIREAGLYSFVLPTWTTLLQRLKMGPLLKEMVHHFQAKTAGRLDRNCTLWVYSAHDATVAALLNTLKVFDIHFPPYAACVVLELRQINGDYFVTLFYRNSTGEEPLLLPIKTCSTVCPLDQFVTLVQPVIPDDWEQECRVLAGESTWPTMFVVSGIVVTLVLLTLTAYSLKKKCSKTISTRRGSCYHTMSHLPIQTNSKKTLF